MFANPVQICIMAKMLSQLDHHEVAHALLQVLHGVLAALAILLHLHFELVTLELLNLVFFELKSCLQQPQLLLLVLELDLVALNRFLRLKLLLSQLDVSLLSLHVELSILLGNLSLHSEQADH